MSERAVGSQEEFQNTEVLPGNVTLTPYLLSRCSAFSMNESIKMIVVQTSSQREMGSKNWKSVWEQIPLSWNFWCVNDN